MLCYTLTNKINWHHGRTVMKMNGLNFARIGTLILAAVLIISGFINGSAGDVLAKAVRICMECIGLG